MHVSQGKYILNHLPMFPLLLQATTLSAVTAQLAHDGQTESAIGGASGGRLPAWASFGPWLGWDQPNQELAAGEPGEL